jgi:hypothetical protein
MPNTAQVNFSITNLNFSVAQLIKGISFVGGITKRGPVADPSTVVTSWPQFVKIYGGLISTSDFPLLCKRALEAGSQLRVSRVVHYTDPADASTSTATKATTTAFANSTPSNLFSLPLKNPGADGNNIRAEVYAASNGDADYFNLKVYHIDEPDLTEIYTNLTIPGQPTVANSHYLDTVIKRSKIVSVTYNDLSALVGTLRPVNVVKTYSTGSNGGTVVDADYIGDSAGGTGFNAFDAYDDAMQVCMPEMSASAIHVAGAAYADTRKDLVYFAHLDHTLTTANDLITERDGFNISSKYTAFFGGGLVVTDPTTGLQKNISELGDILGLAATSDLLFGEWYSFAGRNRGAIRNALNVITNFGTPAMKEDLNLLANHQINMVVAKNGQIQLSGNFSAQLANDQMSFLNTVRFLIALQKSLGPILEGFLEDPADLVTFKKIFRAVEPTLDSYVAKRALFSYVWDGDQNISRIEDVVVNDLNDLAVGKYKVKLYVKIIPSLQEIGIEIIVTDLGVDFSVFQTSTPN